MKKSTLIISIVLGLITAFVIIRWGLGILVFIVFGLGALGGMCGRK